MSDFSIATRLRSRVYVAAPLPLLAKARQAAGALRSEGVRVVSTWHESSPTVEGDEALSPVEQAEAARCCLHEVQDATLLLLLYGEASSRHGNIWEAATAAARKVPILSVPVCKDAVFPTIFLRAYPSHGGISSLLDALTAKDLADLVTRSPLQWPST